MPKRAATTTAAKQKKKPRFHRSQKKRDIEVAEAPEGPISVEETLLGPVPFHDTFSKQQMALPLLPIDFLPQTVPFRSPTDMLAWTAAQDPPSLRAVIACVPRTVYTRRLIHCHDMAGGYREDQCSQGQPLATMYNFHHWKFVDLFIYFSHSFVAPPPVGWINAAHRNGVRVLGTIITEWEAGEKMNLDLINWGGKPNEFPIADQLVALAQHRGFDGWFINIESKLPSSAHAVRMAEFVRYLTERCHKATPQQLVLWYDSIIDTGELKWQDTLNEHNKMFERECDGIFTNYTWKAGVPKQAASMADSPDRVFIGNDMWGRGTFGGAGYDKTAALTEIAEAGTSIALFAPAWTYESQDKAMFYQNDLKLWAGCVPGIGTRASPGSIAQFVEPRQTVQSVLYSDFDTGYGAAYYINGTRHLYPEGPRGNLSTQSQQPLHSFHTSSVTQHIRLTSDIAFCGHNCLAVHCSTQRGEASFELFGPLHVTPEPGHCCIKMTVRCDADAELGLEVTRSDNAVPLRLWPNEQTEEGSTLLKVDSVGAWSVWQYNFTVTKHQPVHITNLRLLHRVSVNTPRVSHLGAIEVGCADRLLPTLDAKMRIVSVQSRQRSEGMQSDHQQSQEVLQLCWEGRDGCESVYVYRRMGEQERQFCGCGFGGEFVVAKPEEPCSFELVPVNKVKETGSGVIVEYP